MLRLRGLMAVAPLGEDPRRVRPARRRPRDFVADHPDATWLSAGMSGDLEAAVRPARHTCVSAPRSSVEARGPVMSRTVNRHSGRTGAGSTGGHSS